MQVLWGSSTDLGGAVENQDEHFVLRLNNNIIVAGVLDGHGKEVGKVAACAAKNELEQFFHEHAHQLVIDPVGRLVKAHEVAHIAIKNAFQKTLASQGYLIQETDEGYLIKKKGNSEVWNCVHGGTSCTIVVIIDDLVYIANVGDSAALLCTQDSVLQPGDVEHVLDAADDQKLHSIDKASSSLSSLLLSADHSPESAEEFHRLRRFRSRQENPELPALQVLYDSFESYKGRCSPVFDVTQNPLRPSGRGHYYKNVRREWASLVATPVGARYQDALAFTRSLGDLHLHTYGVTHLPEVRRLRISNMVKRLAVESSIICLAVATDGVWDNWLYEDVSKFLLDGSCIAAVQQKSSGAQDVCDAFMQRNGILSKRNFGSSADNATTILLYLTIK